MSFIRSVYYIITMELQKRVAAENRQIERQNKREILFLAFISSYFPSLFIRSITSHSECQQQTQRTSTELWYSHNSFSMFVNFVIIHCKVLNMIFTDDTARSNASALAFASTQRCSVISIQFKWIHLPRREWCVCVRACNVQCLCEIEHINKM